MVSPFRRRMLATAAFLALSGAVGAAPWDRSLVLPESYRWRQAAASPEGGTVLAGNLEGPASDVHVVRLDEDGAVVRASLLTTPERDRALGMAVAGDAAVFLAGIRQRDLEDDAGWVVKLAPDDSLAWQRVLTAADHGIFFHEVVALPDGGCLAVGYWGQPPGSAPSDGWAVRLDANGAVVWSRTFDHALDDVVRFGSVRRLAPDRFGLTMDHGLVVEIDGAGTLLTQHELEGPYECLASLDSVEATADGGRMLFGWCEGYSSCLSYQSWLARIAPDGTLSWYSRTPASHLGGLVVRGDELVLGGWTCPDAGRVGSPAILAMDAAGVATPVRVLEGAALHRTARLIGHEDGELSLVDTRLSRMGALRLRRLAGDGLGCRPDFTVPLSETRDADVSWRAVAVLTAEDRPVVTELEDLVVVPNEATVVTHCGVPVPMELPPPGPVPDSLRLRSVAPGVRLEWEPAPGARRHRLVVGSLEALRAGRDESRHLGACELAGREYLDDAPAVPGGSWYRVAGLNAAGAGPLGRDSLGSWVALDPADCP